MCLDKPLVSVIVPVYNGQNTIARCIDSILNQTFQDLELIVVNDGSTDDTGDILEQYITMDARMIVITQKNAGVSAARNTGVSRATGKWITFADADDYLELNCLEEVLLNDNIDKYDLVFWNYYTLKPSGKKMSAVFQKPKGEYKKEEIVPYILDSGGKQGLGGAWCRLFKNELIQNNKLHFHEGVVNSEDRIFMVDYLMHTRCNMGLTKFLYNRTFNANSAIHRWHENAKEEYLLTTRLLKERLLHYGIWDICQKAFCIWVLQDTITQYLKTYICHPQNAANRKSRKKELYVFLNDDLISEAIKQIQLCDLPLSSRMKFIAVKHSCINILDRWYQNKNYF